MNDIKIERKHINYRKWDIRSKKMINLYEYADVYEFFETYWYEDSIMQYIGLNDKNNKNIYEGDIIIHKNLSHIFIVNKVITDYFYVKTIQDKNKITYCLSNNSGETFYTWDGPDVEIVGNIFENKELMK